MKQRADGLLTQLCCEGKHMTAKSDLILTLNAGSSSIKFAVFPVAENARAIATGQIDGIGVKPRLTMGDETHDLAQVHDHTSALSAITTAIGPVLAQGKIACRGLLALARKP